MIPLNKTKNTMRDRGGALEILMRIHNQRRERIRRLSISYRDEKLIQRAKSAARYESRTVSGFMLNATRCYLDERYPAKKIPRHYYAIISI
jgi:hypothetical protein